MSKRDSICVCICTYRRPKLLRELLSRLEEQETEGLYDYSIVVVDNDRSETGREVVESCARKSNRLIQYHIEPEQNIALARNRAVGRASGDFLAFIDDDEFPGSRWLLSLYQAIKRYETDGILGPVLPRFEGEPPGWVLKGRFFERPTHSTGHVLGWQNTRTGNALVRSDLFKDGEWFDPAFGSGGEDREFFRRKIGEGRTFVWCDEAPVFETVTPKRWERTVLLKRALIRGKMGLNATESKCVGVLKSTIAIAIYTMCLPVFLLLGHHVLMRYLIKECDHLGKVLAFLGIDPVSESYIGG